MYISPCYECAVHICKNKLFNMSYNMTSSLEACAHFLIFASVKACSPCNGRRILYHAFKLFFRDGSATETVAGGGKSAVEVPSPGAV